MCAVSLGGCLSNHCHAASCQVIMGTLPKLRGKLFVGLLSQKWGIVVRRSSWWEKKAVCRQVVNDPLIMVTLKDWEFSSLLVSVLGLREPMLSHKDLHAVPCWVCLYLSSVASSFDPWEPLTGSSSLPDWHYSEAWILNKKNPKTQLWYNVCNFLLSYLIYWKVFSPGIWVNLNDPVWPERRAVGCSLQPDHVWTHPKFQGIFICRSQIWL